VRRPRAGAVTDHCRAAAGPSDLYARKQPQEMAGTLFAAILSARDLRHGADQ
jgi:hypothetical protein